MRRTVVQLCALSALLLAASVAGQERWWAMSTGSVSARTDADFSLNSGDDVVAVALDGHTRFVLGTLGESAAARAVSFTHGEEGTTYASASSYIAQIDGLDTASFVLAPSPCTELLVSGACSETAATFDNGYHQDNIDYGNLAGFAVVEGKAVAAYKLENFDKPYFFGRWDSWTLAAEGLPYRKANNLNPNDATNGDASEYYFTTKDSTLSSRGVSTANGTMFAFFELEGVAKISVRYANGSESRALIINGTSLFQMKLGAATFDSDDGATVDDLVIRSGYFVIAVDAVSGDVKYITPIWGQNSGARSGDIDFAQGFSIAASNYDGSLYMMATLNSRIVLGDPIALPMYSNATSGRYVIDTFPATSYEVGVARDAAGTFIDPFSNDNSRLLLAVDATGKYRGHKTFKVSNTPTGATYANTAGTWDSIRADDNSTDVYLYGSLDRDTNIANSDNANKLVLNANSYSLTTDGPGSTGADSKDGFFAKFDGGAPGDASWVYMVKGIDDLPSVEEWTVVNSSVYAVVSFTNVTMLPSGVDTDASTDMYVISATAGQDFGTPADNINRRRLASVQQRTTARRRNMLAVAFSRPDPDYTSNGGYDYMLLRLSSAGARSGDVPRFHVIGGGSGTFAGITSVDAYEGKVYVHGTFAGGLTFQSIGNSTTYAQDVALHSRKNDAESVFWAVYAEELPDAPKEKSDDDDDDENLAIGLGIGLGVGIPVLAAIILVIWKVTAGSSAAAA